MCQCGNTFCDLKPDDSIWANDLLDKIMTSEVMIKRFPDEFSREYYGEVMVREELAHRNDPEFTSGISRELEI